MEPTFQTTFIPKRPTAPVSVETKPSGVLVLFSVLATIVFIASILLYGLLFFYKKQILSSIQTTDQSLTRQSETFDANLVVELNDINRRLRSAETLLSQHTVITPIFKSLQDITLKTIQYSTFSLQMPGPESPNVTVKMSGTADGYEAIALQSDMFSKNRFFKDPLFSNLNPDEKGNVDFQLSFLVDPSFVLYKTYINQ